MEFEQWTAFFDVDGVLSDGSFIYTKKGKAAKVFGTGDSDALKVLKGLMNVRLVTADHKGSPIAVRRAKDMKIPLLVLSPRKRADYFASLRSSSKIFYMGDSFLDQFVFRSAHISACPADGDPAAKAAATFVTGARAGRRAVSEAVFRLLEELGASTELILQEYFEAT